MSDAARKAESQEEFSAKFLVGHKKEAWEQLLREWRPLLQKASRGSIPDSSEDEKVVTRAIVIDRLRRIRVRTMDEDSLAEAVSTKLRTLIRIEPDSAREGLAAYALENIHKTIYADNLWAWASDRGYRRVEYAKDSGVLGALEALNERYESMIKPIREDISISRSEVDEVIDLLLGEGLKRSALVSGEAGIGKTVILGQAIQQIRKRGIPHLYFRVDRLNPTELPQNIGEQLGLPASPVEILANVAKGRNSVLIIDQLDAVSLASGRNPEFFECIHEIIRQARAFPKMHLLMACRRFDLDKDNRLRELISEKGPALEVKASLFSVDDVRTSLKELGHSKENFSDRQIELLRLPLHLALFAQVYTDSSIDLVAFAAASDLFNAYWDRKRRAVERRTDGHSNQWTMVLDRLCDVMTERQTLFVHETIVLDDFEPMVRAMESEHVLVLDERRVGFFHEGFFDYVFARRFIAKGSDLVDYLKTDEQHLFKRAPLRQILLYQYEVDPKECIGNLRRILNDSNIRLHLKKSALDAASKIDKATPMFWNLLQEIIQSENPPLVNGAWSIMIMGRSWFPFLNARGILSKWLAADNPETREQTLRIFSNQIEKYPEEIVALLHPYVGESDEWNRQIPIIILRRAFGKSRIVFDLFLEMVRKGAVEEQSAQDFWMYIHDLPNSHPEWAAEAIGLYLRISLDGVKNDEIQGLSLKKNIGGRTLQDAFRKPCKFRGRFIAWSGNSPWQGGRGSP